MRRTLLEPAPAKLNLALSVDLADEVSGMHAISSWMVTVDFVDDLHVSRLEDGSISRYSIDWHASAPRRSEINWRLTDDLAVRAHLAMERYTGRQLPIQLRMEKRIPVGGGLGGGSSNAAAMLRACNQLFDLHLDADTLRHIAASLGSDVPFLVEGGSAIVSGFGERIEPQCTLPDCAAVLILPEVSCSTGAVYQRYDATAASPLDSDAVTAAVTGGPLFNDLALSAMEVAPDLKRLAGHVEATAGRDLHVSGSGSTLFLVCDTSFEAGTLASAITSHHDVPSVPVRPADIESGCVEMTD
ncbi:MAG: 4-(cytidine 5'-diphospho)-2-C-methyl-D-erythritol kinase [Phycisphaerales bacterium]|jgi:4-diphosphocytidyl-2-C-methyl-D-erythritol kinase|nr:4-(cytidine 5'-diphospho)-2-C-methyl-D-erythritol kinase [Phycisphaerales bacterium]